MSRRVFATVAAIALSVLFVGIVTSLLHQATRELTLPLSDAGIIREQAAQKRLEPALIAAVIYAETKFDPRPSSAGAQGLMQILPSTAYYLAHLSGGVRFTASDLAKPSVNVAYGSYYLRYLLDHYRGDEMLAVAAYNGGIGNVDSWVARARAAGRRLSVEEIPFAQTREYVQRVLSAQRAYRATYPRQLGIS
ncbi:MAG TPA: lytic transglycosylase domain-containing protein [Solirubrobacteraceae bacterium]|nr:lytic transglycosylase domain-containing protein [Solirubrobacteraceae bacterium]